MDPKVGLYGRKFAPSRDVIRKQILIISGVEISYGFGSKKGQIIL